ncbi:MAG: hypothetical protein JXA77_11415, partial [Bacteroidales bacterium]|nr:hypothetical protein [Bacteroidales bacterium]
KISPEYTRKAAHIACGIISLSFPVYFNSVWPVLIIGLIFLLILAYSKKKKFLQSVNGIKRKSFGSELYTAAIVLCFWAFKNTNDRSYFYIPLLLLFISDPIAALAGTYIPIKKHRFSSEGKSMGGTLFFFVSATAIISIYYLISEPVLPHGIVALILIPATVSTIAETTSKKGIDNISIPASLILTLIIWNNFF